MACNTRDDGAILGQEDTRTGLTEGPSIFWLLVRRHEYEQKREKRGKSFFYYRSSALSLPLPMLMLLLALQPSRWEGSFPVVGAQSLLCRLSSSKKLRERARSAMVRVKLMALDEHPSRLHPWIDGMPLPCASLACFVSQPFRPLIP